MHDQFASRARGIVACHYPRGINTEAYEDAVWMAASVLHDISLIPTSPRFLLEAAPHEENA